MNGNSTPKYAPLGARIRSARKRAGLSHDQLGRIVGTSRQHLIRLEKGDHRPREGMLAAIASATGTTVEALEGPRAASPVDEEAARMRQMTLTEVLNLRIDEAAERAARKAVMELRQVAS